MVGRGDIIKDHHHNRWIWDKIVPPECAPGPSILHLSSDLRWEEAHEPLHFDIDTQKVCGVGLGMAFANTVKNRLDTDSAVIGMVPCASGGTAIKECERGSHLYETMVKRTDESLKFGEEIKAVLWYQGESDVLDLHDAEEQWKQYGPGFEEEERLWTGYFGSGFFTVGLLNGLSDFKSGYFIN